MLSKNIGWRSRKDLSRIPDPGVKNTPDPGSGSATLFYFYNFNSPYFYLSPSHASKKIWVGDPGKTYPRSRG
jgi:hypothetical protein